MTIIHQAITIFLAFLLLGCGSERGYTSNSVTVDTPRSFVENYGLTDTTRLFAFVGEKVSVDTLPHTPGSMDNGFKAKYAILEKIYGNFQRDTIEFVAYDHYGIPPFSKFKNALLFVSADSGTYYHQKYMFNDVYRTKDGRWAGTYAVDDYEHPYNKHTTVKPIKIDFAERVIYPTREVSDDGEQLFVYPTPYFKTIGDSAIALYGNYAEELFVLKKNGFLTSRGLFEATPEQEEDMVESMQPETPKSPPSADDLKFLTFWKTFVAALDETGLKRLKSIALDTLYVCDQLVAVDKFIYKCLNEVIDDEVRKRIVDRTKLECSSTDVEMYNLVTLQAKKEIIKFGDSYRLRKMLVTRSTKNNNPPTIYFGFIETKKGYRLYEIGHHWHKQCCE